MAFRLDEATKSRLDAVAAAHALEPAVFVRSIVLREIGSLMKTPPVRRRILHRDMLRQALGELGAQGSNLNQIARSLNSQGSRTLAAKELAGMQQAYLAALRALTSTLGAGDAP
jgi:hypothetical protein